MIDMEKRMIDFLLTEATRGQIEEFFGYASHEYTKDEVEDNLALMPDDVFDELVKKFGLSEDLWIIRGSEDSVIRTYLTNCKCPKCDGQLKTSDIKGYPFMCPECDENFYGIEVKGFCGDLVEVSIPWISETEFEEKVDDLYDIMDEAGAVLLGYDNLEDVVDIGWECMPSAEQVEVIVRGLSKIGH